MTFSPETGPVTAWIEVDPSDPYAVIGSALLIFALRVTDVSIDTLRVLSMVRGARLRAAVFGFLEAAIFISALVQVLRPPILPVQMAAYALGFATGTFSGMTIAGFFASGYLLMRVISRRKGAEIAARLRREGFAVTEVEGHGKDGPVPILFSVIPRSEGDAYLELVREVDETAFITSEPIDKALGGTIPRPHSWTLAVRK